MSLDTLHTLVAALARGKNYGVAISSVGRVYRVRINVANTVVAHAEERDLDKAVQAAVEGVAVTERADGELEFMLRRSIQLAKETKSAKR